MIDLAELLRLEREATPEPWQEGEGYDSDAIVHPLPSYEVPIAGGGSFTERPRPETVFSGGSVGYENASLVASAEDKAFVISLRNAFPGLASELERLRDRCARAEWLLRSYTNRAFPHEETLAFLAAPGAPDG